MIKLQKKYKIALVAYRLAGGGADKVMVNLSKYFDAYGIDVHIITVIDEGHDDYKGTVFSTQQHKSNEGWLGRVTRLKALYTYLRKEQFDYIIDFRFRIKKVQEFLMARFIYNAPTILTIHSAALEQYIPQNKKWARATYQKAFAVICITKYIQKQVANTYQFKNLTLLYNPVDITKVQQYAQAPIELEEPFILMVGQMESDIKQVDHLLKAYAASAKKWPLVICGTGGLMATYQALAIALGCGDSVHFVGFQRNPYAFMSKAKFTVLCSAFEGLPNVLIESLACETPVVSYDCISGPDEIIQNEHNGLLVENQNILALTHAMNRMMTEEALWQYCKQNALASVQKFDLPNIGQQWIQLMQLS